MHNIVIIVLLLANFMMAITMSLLVEKNRVYFQGLLALQTEINTLRFTRDELLLQKKYDYSPIRVLNYSKKNLDLQLPLRNQIIWGGE